MLLTPILLTSTLALSGVRIDQVLPDTSIAVFSVDNVAAFGQDFNEMGVCDTYHDLFQVILKETSGSDACPLNEGSCTDFLASIGVEVDQIPPLPSGNAGMGFYPVVDAETGAVGFGIMGMVELGDSKWVEILEKSLKEAESAHDEVEAVDLAGHQVWKISGYMPENIEIPPMAMGFDIASFSRFYISLSDGYFVFGTDPDGIADALAAFSGDLDDHALTNSDLYTNLKERCGDGDVFAALLLTNLSDAVVQMDQSGMSMMFLPMLKSIVGDIDGFAESVTLSPSDDLMLSGTYVAYMGDGRNGLMGLIGTDAPKVSVPNFIGEDTIYYSQLQIDFEKFVPFMKDVIVKVPMLAMQVGPQMEQMETMMAQALAPLGKQCHIITSGHLPITSDSLGYLAAIECLDEEAFGAFLNSTLPMAGAEPSDFLGNQIFTMDVPTGMMPIDLSFSFAIAGGYVFMGTTHSVEGALRTIANPSEAGRQRMNLTAQHLPNSDTSGWGYGNPRKGMEIQMEMMETVTKDMFTEMEEFDPEMAEEMRTEFEQQKAMQDALMKSITTFLGPMAWDLTANESGFVSHVFMSRPSD